jgi:hypothetical protein
LEVGIGGDVAGEEVITSAEKVELKGSAPVPSAEVSDSAAVVAPEAEASSVEQEAVGAAETEQQVLETEVVDVGEEVEAPEVIVEEAGNVEKGVADVCALRGLEYPVTLVGEEPVLDESEAEGVVEREAEEDTSLLSEVTEEVQEAVLGNSPSTDDETEEAESTSTVDECTAPAPSTDDNDAEAEHEPPAEADLDLEIDAPHPNTTPSASTTSLFIPGPFVTERKTVRVFETVTETVRVSVVTQTETVSTVVTAVPQTVEETVYETETVKITVSVPVEEQMVGKQKAKATKGCKKGWF